MDEPMSNDETSRQVVKPKAPTGDELQAFLAVDQPMRDQALLNMTSEFNPFAAFHEWHSKADDIAFDGL
ncbi:MAG: hypothetical protein ACRCUE_21805 [Bosea sp. (in: a-proteobacteria)]